ncbi:MAG: glycosyltransferase family 4 protein [Candidatus Rariloculaceae bacterium]
MAAAKKGTCSVSFSGYYLYMRIVHLESGRHLYGGAQQVCYLLAGLAAEGIDNVLVCPRDSAIANTVSGYGGVEVIQIPIGGDLDFALSGRLRRLFEAHQPSLVHVHSRRGVDLFGGWNARWTGVPAILTRRVESAEYKLLAYIKYWPYAAIIAISRAIKEQLKEKVGGLEDRIYHVASGIEADRYRPAPPSGHLTKLFNLPGDTFKIGIVAQLIERKGHARLFEVLPELIKAHPAVRVLCFGQGPLEGKLRQQIDDLGLAEKVRFAGFRDDLATLLPDLDCLVHVPDREGLGVAVLEALSCGLPVLTSAVGGLVDMIEHESTGLLVNLNEDGALLEALRRIVQDGTLRARLGSAARKQVEAEFSADRMIRGNLSVYRTVLERKI